MNQWFNHLKVHSGALVVAALVGLLMVAPHVWFWYVAGDQYQGITIMGSDAETHYLARINEMAQGGDAGNPFILEEKGTLPTSAFTVAEWILALPTMLTGVSVSVMNLVYKATLAPIAFMLFYTLCWRLIRHRTLAVGAATLAIVGPSLFSLAELGYLLRWEEVHHGFLMYARPVNPTLSGIVFFVYLHLLVSAYQLPSGARIFWGHWGMLGLLYGLSFYIYFYTWTFLTVLNGLFVLVLIAERRLRDVYGMLFVGLLAGVIAVPYVYNLYQFTHHPYFADISKTFGLVYSHMPRVSTGGMLAFIAFIGTVFIIPIRNGWRLIALFLAAAFMVINQQVVTGTVLQEGHYHWYYNIPLFALVLVWAIERWVTFFNWQRIGYICAAIMILVSFAGGVQVQWGSYRFWEAHTFSQQRYAPIFQWLTINAPLNSVVLASTDMAELIPVYTPHNVFWSDFNFTYLIPRERVERALFIYLALHAIAPAEMPEAAFHPPTELGEPAYEYRETAVLLGDKKGYLNGFYPDGMAQKYHTFNAANWNERLSDFTVDYIVVDRLRYPHWETTAPEGTEVFRTETLSVIQLAA
jgi:hypothetical protein